MYYIITKWLYDGKDNYIEVRELPTLKKKYFGLYWEGYTWDSNRFIVTNSDTIFMGMSSYCFIEGKNGSVISSEKYKELKRRGKVYSVQDFSAITLGLSFYMSFADMPVLSLSDCDFKVGALHVKGKMLDDGTCTVLIEFLNSDSEEKLLLLESKFFYLKCNGVSLDKLFPLNSVMLMVLDFYYDKIVKAYVIELNFGISIFVMLDGKVYAETNNRLIQLKADGKVFISNLWTLNKLFMRTE